MKSRYLLAATLLGAAALLSGCNDNNTPLTPVITNPTPPPVAPPVTPRSMSFSELAASLIAMIMGTSGSNGCNTALPTDINGGTQTDDMTAQDANAITVNCT